MPVQTRLLLLLLACNGFIICSKAQTSAANDSLFLQQSVANATILQQRGLAENLRLYNGVAYTGSYSGTKGFPFFAADTLQPGSLLYDGVLYRNVPMLFDLTTGDLLADSYNHGYNIKLVTNKVSDFYLAGHRFTRLENDSTHGTVINPGFYDLMHDNKTQVLVKREKKLEQIARTEGLDARYKVYEYYFIKKNDAFYRVESSTSLLNIFADKKNEVKNYLRENHLKFKKNPELTIIKAAEFYDHLTR